VIGAGVEGLSPERAAIVRILIKHGKEMIVEKVAEVIGIPAKNAKAILHKMHQAGQIERPRWGCYAMPEAQGWFDFADSPI
jgi:predicted transcriptional regulator of viral defense system